jgi:hypothetical protein
VPYADFHDPQSLNLYGFVRGLPTTRIDADGHWPQLLSPETVQKIGEVFIQVANEVSARRALLCHMLKILAWKS